METMESAPAAVAVPGLFVLPTISPEIPYVLEQASERSRVLARFALAGEASGVALPGGQMQSVQEVVAQQWTDFVSQRYEGLGQTLLGHPRVEVSDELLTIYIGADQHLPTFQLKPVVEPLEVAMAGLGWFVNEVLEQARCSGLFMYDMAMVAYHLDYRLSELDEFTDECFARLLLAEEGAREYEDDSPVSEDKIAALREQYVHWPSDILNSVGGHAHLLGTVSYKPKAKKQRNGRPASTRAVKRWLKTNGKHPQAPCVSAALDVHAALTKKGAPEFGFFQDEYSADMESIGAMCFLAWDDPHLLWETAAHAEENSYNAGDVVEAYARKTLPLKDGVTDQQLAGLVVQLKDYLNAWHLLERLMSHLSVHGDDDEI
ncbi:MAG: PRTRC system protein F [Hydrogenophaga sp.]|uniref:PRTRC system protein F n=1 Tax=Hydrogenophaga sp. TaxID=1904254 RepID=UPI002624E005|nr:PRTRC system protein F [Hydrogenophaga sp.]MCV0439049.1 PRTRC system protein F [Hydrogenophaga sp.]